MKIFRIAFLVLLFLAVTALVVLYLVTHEIAVLEPVGKIARKERDLFYDTALLMLLVVIPATVLTLIFAWIYRASKKGGKYSPDWDHSNWAETVWWGVPFVIIIVLSIITWISTHELNPFKPLDSD